MELKAGMIIETQEGRRYLVKDGDLLMGMHDWMSLEDYSDDLTINIDDLDIVAVYESSARTLSDLFSDAYLTVLWKREPKTDWNSVPEFTEVLVRDSSTETWKRAYFLKKVGDSFKTTVYSEFMYSKNSGTCYWKHCKLFKGED